MRKPTICIHESKDADQLCGKCEADQGLRLFAIWIVQFLYLLIQNFQSLAVLWLYSPVCVGPGQKLHCWFSHETFHLLIFFFLQIGEARALYNLGNVYHAKGKHNGRNENQDPGEFAPDVKDCLKKAAEYYE